MYKLVFALCSVGMTLLPISASGQDKNNYISGAVGYFVYTGDVKDDTRLDGAFIGEITYGRKLGSNFVLEGAIGYIHDAHEGDELTGYLATLTLLRSFRFDEWELIAGAGVGAFPMEFTGRVGNVSIDDEDTVGGGHLVLGGRFPAGESGFFGIEGKYRIFEDAVFEGQSLEMDGFSAVLNLGYRF